MLTKTQICLQFVFFLFKSFRKHLQVEKFIPQTREKKSIAVTVENVKDKPDASPPTAEQQGHHLQYHLHLPIIYNDMETPA